MDIKKKITMHDVAKKAGVSYQTVSRVLNNSCNVSNSTKEKIEQAIAELKYVPNLLAQQLAKKEVKRCYNEILAINSNAKIILMTHHCLSPKVISPKYKKGLLNASYCSDLEKWIDKMPNIRLVISGHVHNRCDFVFGKNNTRYIVNPCGYILHNEDKNDPPFNPNLIIDTVNL